MCNNRTVESVQSWAEVGERVGEARRAAGLSQGVLAERIGLDRTAVVRIEAGERKVSALELLRLAEHLDVPPAYLMTRPPAAVVSQRTALEEDADLASRARYRMDIVLQTHLRYAQWLVGHGFLVPAQPIPPAKKMDSASAVDMARRARQAIGVPDGPLGPMASVTEQFGLYLVVVRENVEGASILVDDFGVAAIGGSDDPARRRWTAAHELGHHLLQDAYHSDVGVATSQDERELIIDKFAGEFLLPESDLRSSWQARGPHAEVRSLLVALAAQYRLSWSAVVSTALNHGLIDRGQARRLRADNPVRGEFLAVCGSEPAHDLDVGSTGARWKQAVLAAWDAGAITDTRAVELLYDAISVADLPYRTEPDDEL